MQIDQFDSMIEAAAQKAGVPFSLAKAQMVAESSGNPEAVSPAGAIGLWQIEPINLKDPDVCTAAWQIIMGRLAKRYSDIRLALAAYDWGEGNLNKLIAERGSEYDSISGQLPAETKNYVDKIMKLQMQYANVVR
jgi:membrane-bound lytic murein transglycosylase D